MPASAWRCSAADQLLYNYRAFATLLAKGVTLEELTADLLMNARGTSRGHGGIMHVTAPERGIVGRNGVFGSKFGIALGLAQEIVLHRREARPSYACSARRKEIAAASTRR